MKHSKQEKIYRIIAGVMIGSAFVGFLYYSFKPKRLPSIKIETSVEEVGAIDLTFLKLEIADSREERASGLSNRESLDADSGMLFLFDEPGIYPFWMKDTLFPLDIIWINENEIVDLATLPPEKAGFLMPQHVPTRKADKVLELKKGQASELGLRIGAKVILPTIAK